MDICKKENCNDIARYGVVNPETGMFEKYHCKNHKENNEIGNAPKWQFRYNDVDKITANRNVKLLDSIEEFIEKTIKDGQNAYLLLQCLVCLNIVTTTNINHFVHGKLGCSCSNKIPWYKKPQEFLEICKERNTKLLDTKEEYLEKTKKKENMLIYYYNV